MRKLLILPAVILFSCGSAQEEKKETKSEESKTATEVEIEKEQEGMHDETRPIGFATISVDEFEKQIESPCTVLDVRTPGEVAEGIIPNATVMNIQDADFAQQIATLDKSKPVLIICQKGPRAYEAAILLKQNGFEKTAFPRFVAGVGDTATSNDRP